MSELHPAVLALRDRGPLPDDDADYDTIAEIERLIGEIEQPNAVREAEALLPVFSDHDCYGLAWALLHMIERSGFTFTEVPEPSNEWIQRLWDRHERALAREHSDRAEVGNDDGEIDLKQLSSS